jgi:DNA-binding MarR family transcriptional regulator
MAETPAAADLQLVPLLDYLARIGRRAGSGTPDALRPRHVIALRLLEDGGPVGQQALAEALSLDPSNVVVLLNDLESRELVARRRDPADRRRHIVEISEKGRGELGLACNHFGRIEDVMFASLSADERQTLHALLARAATTAPTQGCTAADFDPSCTAD